MKRKKHKMMVKNRLQIRLRRNKASRQWTIVAEINNTTKKNLLICLCMELEKEDRLGNLTVGLQTANFNGNKRESSTKRN